jgi:hypothetical protein
MLMPMLRRALAVGVLISGLGAGAPAFAGTVITTTVTGIIGAGTDQAGVLFAPGTDLAGKGFTASFTIPEQFNTPSGVPSNGSVTAAGGPGSAGLTIVGGAAPFQVAVGFGVFGSGGDDSLPSTAVFASVFGATGGYDLNGSNVSVAQAVTGILADATLLQTFSLTGPFDDPDDFAEAKFYIYSDDGVNTPVLLLSFTAQARDFSLVSMVVTQVPEPTGLAVLAVAGAGLLAARRRRPA